MRTMPFTRPTLIAAVELLEGHSQGHFNQMVLRLVSEDDIPSSAGLSVTKKCDLLGRIVVQRLSAVLETTEGSMTLAEAVVREAVQLAHSEPTIASVDVSNLSLADHCHCLESCQRSPRRSEPAEAEPRPDQALDAPVILLNDVVEIFELPHAVRRQSSPSLLMSATTLG